MDPTQYSKHEALSELADFLAVPVEEIEKRGGTGTRDALAMIAAAVGLPDSGAPKQLLAEEIASAAGLPWDPTWNSTGSTITAAGWAQVLMVTKILSDTTTVAIQPEQVGRTYVQATSVIPHSPSEVTIDLDALDRGTMAHRAFERRIADFVTNQGLEPRSPRQGEPRFDVAWNVDADIVVCEVKSAIPSSLKQQRRLGLGQVLEYRHQLAQIHDRPVRAVLALAIEADPLGRKVCQATDVALVLEGTLEDDLIPLTGGDA